MPRQPRCFRVKSAEEATVLEELTRATHHSSREPRTHANRARFIRYYVELCESRSVDPFPASRFDVACFLVKYVTELKSVASLNDALSAIRTEAREAHGQDFTKADEWYFQQVRRGLRKKYRAQVKRKRPMTLKILVPILLVADLNVLEDLQLMAMGFLCHDACLRSKELLDLLWRDIKWELDAAVLPRVCAINIQVSKARYTDAPETVRIPLYDVGGVKACGVQLLWLYTHSEAVLDRQAGQVEGFLFPRLHRCATPCKALTKDAFVKYYRRRLTEAGFPAQEFAGHSFRAGGATDLHTGKVPEALGRLLGRWRSREVYFLYLREAPEEQAAKVCAAFQAAWGGARPEVPADAGRTQRKRQRTH